MTHTEAERLLGVLVGGTSGWTNAPPETFTIYTRQLAGLADAQAAFTAIDHIIQTWTEPRRPPVATVRAGYQAVLRRAAMERPALPSGAGTLVSVTDGRRIAARAYAETCSRRDADTDIHIGSGWRSVDPSPRTLDAMLGIIGTDL